MITKLAHRVINRIAFGYRSHKRKRIARKYIFSDLKRPVKRNRVNLHYWRFSENEDNVGDLLSKIVVEYLLATRQLLLDKQTKKTHHLMAIGSIINHAKHDTVIWGSGVHDYEAVIPKVKFDVRAIRGPLSRDFLMGLGIHCPNVYGDPAILLPDFYFPEVRKTREYLVIPHYSKEKKYMEKYANVVSTLTSDWRGFISDILGAELIISSSLHGLIVAEAYGVPAVLLDDIDKDYLKYNDYYLSTGRGDYKKAKTVEEALSLGPEPLPDFTLTKKGLYESFPYDLWH